MQSKNNLLATKQLLKITYFVALLFFILLTTSESSLVFAHGGEDHGEEQSSTPVANVGEVNTKLAKASTAELFLKYPTPKAGEPITIRVFLTDLITNAPIDKAKVSLNFQYLGVQKKAALSFIPELIPAVQATTSNLVITTNPTNITGMYEAKVTFPNVGQYSLLASINSSNLDAQAFISGILVTENLQASQATTNSNNSIVTITVVIITLVSMIMLILLYLFFLRTDNLKQPKVEKDIL
jgi:hypothetical protein